MASKTVTVGPGQTYASLQAAITGEVSANANLVTMGGILNIVLYAVNDTTSVNVTGFTVNSTCYVNIYTDATARHAGVWDGNKYNLQLGNAVTGIAVNCAYTRITGLQIGVKTTSYYGASFAGIITEVANTTITGNIIRCVVDVWDRNNPNTWGIDEDTYAGGHKWYNNIIYGFTMDTTNVGGIYIFGPVSYLFNNTIVGCKQGIHTGSSVTEQYKNNLISGSTIPIQGNGGNDYTGCGYNATDSANWGAGTDYTSRTGDRVSQTFTFSNAGASDYRITTGDAGAYQHGTDLSADSNCPFSLDITGANRTVPWSIGAHQPSGGSAAVTGAAFLLMMI